MIGKTEQAQKLEAEADDNMLHELPEAGAYLWFWFLDLLRGVDCDDYGAPVVTWHDVAAWAGLTATAADPWEIRALLRLGLTARRIIDKNASDEFKRKMNTRG